MPLRIYWRRLDAMLVRANNLAYLLSHFRQRLIDLDLTDQRSLHRAPKHFLNLRIASKLGRD